MKTLNVVIPAYNEEKNIKRCIGSVLSQELTDTDLFITVVDDCSSDKTRDVVNNCSNENVILLSNDKNLGRSKSRNRGGYHIPNADYLYFLDGDCYFKDNKCIKNMLIELEKNNADICIGDVYASGITFWDKYYNFSRKGKNSEEKWSSQNFLIKKKLFVQIAGFDEMYQNYGFEDRDLFYTCLKKDAKINFVSDSVVNTFCMFSIEQSCRKMYLAGKSSAGIFMQKHPDIYKKTAYYKLHYRKRKVDKFLLIILKYKIVFIFFYNLKLPFWLKQKITKLLLALCFFEGTHEISIS